MNLPYVQFLNWVKPNDSKVLEWHVRVGKDYAPFFPLSIPELTAFLPGQESYTYDILVSHAQGRAQP